MNAILVAVWTVLFGVQPRPYVVPTVVTVPYEVLYQEGHVIDVSANQRLDVDMSSARFDDPTLTIWNLIDECDHVGGELIQSADGRTLMCEGVDH
jgi:hypothetical protein